MKDLDKRKIMELALDSMLKDPRGLDMMKKIMESEELKTEEEFRKFMIENAEVGECSIEDAKKMMKKMDGLYLSKMISEEEELKKLIKDNKDNDPRTTYEIEINTIIKCIYFVDNMANIKGIESFIGLKDSAMKESGATNDEELAKWLYDLPRGGKYAVFNEVREYLTRKMKLDFEKKMDEKIKDIEEHYVASEVVKNRSEEIKERLKMLMSRDKNGMVEMLKKKIYEKHNIKNNDEFIDTIMKNLPREVLKGIDVINECEENNLSHDEYRRKIKSKFKEECHMFDSGYGRKAEYSDEDTEKMRQAMDIINSLDNSEAIYTISAIASAKAMTMENTQVVAGEDKLSEYILFRGSMARKVVNLCEEHGLFNNDEDILVKPQTEDNTNNDDEPVIVVKDKYKNIIQ